MWEARDPIKIIEEVLRALPRKKIHGCHKGAGMKNMEKMWN